MGNYVEDLYPYTNFITVRLSTFAPPPNAKMRIKWLG